MKFGRLGAFLTIAIIILSLTAGTVLRVWKAIPLGLDLKGGISLLYDIQPPKGKVLTQGDIQAAVQAVETRVNSLGVSSPIINVENGNEISVQLAGVSNQQNAEKVIGETAQLAIYRQVTVAKGGQIIPIKTSLLITGSDIANHASVGQNQLGQTVVDVTFKNKEKWSNITKRYLGKTIYLFLNGRLINSAQIDSVIEDGQTSIGPLNSFQESQTLARQLNAGALPLPLKLVSSTSIGPQLGASSLKSTMDAGLISIGLIFIFMMVIYRVAGLIATIALVAYAYLTLLVFAVFPITLTLPGLAALILGLGIAVDANIIAYERIKDEIQNGRSLKSAVLAGSKRAFRTIFDSNAATFIAAMVMFWLGQGEIRGFAVALMVGILVSLLTAVLLSRTMLTLFTRANLVRSSFWYGARKGGLPK